MRLLIYCILASIYFNQDSYSQCANHSQLKLVELSKYEKFDLRKFDRALISTIARKFGLNGVKGYYFSDEGYNSDSIHKGGAYAQITEKEKRSTIRKFGKSKYGYIGLGKNFAELTLTPKVKGQQRIAFLANFIVAHEIAHLAQRKGYKLDTTGIQELDDYPVKYKELNADFAAGMFIGSFYLSKLNDSVLMSTRKRDKYKKRRSNIIKAIAKYVYSIGDFDKEKFYNHHGTPEERLLEFKRGLVFGIRMGENLLVPYLRINWKDLTQDYCSKNE